MTKIFMIMKITRIMKTFDHKELYGNDIIVYIGNFGNSTKLINFDKLSLSVK